MLKNSTFPGSNNGTGLFQTIVGLKVRRDELLLQEMSCGFSRAHMLMAAV